MHKSFRPSSVKCHELFNDDTDLYRIPRYQRPYSWADDHINQLLDDLYEAWSDEPNSPYYLGSIILVDNSDGGRLSILDGQQRITTLTIIYAVLDKSFSERLTDTEQKLVRSRIMEKDLNKTRLRSDRQADLERSVIDHLQLDQTNRYTVAAKTVIDNLHDKFGDSGDNLGDFFRYIDKKVELIRIDTTNLSYAVRLFQTINTRGKSLTVSDLTKSYLLANLDNDEDKDTVVEIWQQITGIVDDDYERLDSVLRMYRRYLREAKAKQAVYEELKDEFQGHNPKDIVRDIRSFVREFKQIENASDRWIFMLDNLTHEAYWKTLLITARKENISYYDDLRKLLVAFYYSYWIADYTAEKIKNPSIELLRKIKAQADLAEVRNYVDEKRNNDNVPGRVREELTSSNVYDERWHKSLLIALEYVSSTTQKTARIDPSGELHREHVLPRNFQSAKQKYQYWSQNFEDAEAERLKDTLGNLVALQYDLNSAAAQKPFPQKTQIYRGEAAKPRSSFGITLRVADSDNYGDWTPQTIERHRDFLLKVASELMLLPADELTKTE